MVEIVRIELTLPEYQSGALPLSYISLVPREGFEPPTTLFRRQVLCPLSYRGMVENIRIELMTSGCKPDVLPLAPIPHGTEREIRTLTEQVLNLLPLPIGLPQLKLFTNVGYTGLHHLLLHNRRHSI